MAGSSKASGLRGMGAGKLGGHGAGLDFHTLAWLPSYVKELWEGGLSHHDHRRNICGWGDPLAVITEGIGGEG